MPSDSILDVDSIFNENGVELSGNNDVPGSWKVYVKWSPPWDTKPVGWFVQFCGGPVNIVNVTYNNDAPPYYSAVIEFTYTGEIMCVPPIPIRVVVTFSRTCTSEDTFLWGGLVDS